MTSDRLKFESAEQIAGATAAGLAEAAAHYAFKLFSDKKFRRLAGFDALNQIETDRISHFGWGVRQVRLNAVKRNKSVGLRSA